MNSFYQSDPKTVNSDAVAVTDDSWVDALRPRTKRLVYVYLLKILIYLHIVYIGIFHWFTVVCCSGSLLAVVAGLMYGSSFIPVLYIKYHAADPDSKYKGASQFGKSSLSL